MGKVTLVLNFEDGKEPRLYSRQNILGGELIGFAWSDLQEKIESLEKRIEELEDE